MNYLKLLELLLTAVATVAATAIVITVAKRLILIRLFRSRCELAFSRAIIQDKDLSQENKKFWQDLFTSKMPSGIRLFFSRKPLEIPAWFTSEEIDGFFIPAYKFNDPAKEAKSNHSVLNYKKYG